MPYAEFEDSSYTELRKNLLKKKVLTINENFCLPCAPAANFRTGLDLASKLNREKASRY